MKYGMTVSGNNKLVNLDGLANVEGAINGIFINENTILRNLCGITRVVKGGGNTGGYQVTGNAYNPTVQQIIAGLCSQ
jgi:hypothetical protein